MITGGIMERKIRRRLSAGLATLGLATVASLAVAQPAEAAPTGCGAGWMGNGATYASAYCSGGTGTYQVWIQCSSTVWPYGWSFKESAWYRPGTGPAVVWCGVGSTIARRGIGLRN
jgi:hypothetical protein